MVKVAQICSTWSMYQKYDQHARNMVKKNRVMVKIPELWLTYHKYGRHTRNMAAFSQFFLPLPLESGKEERRKQNKTENPSKDALDKTENFAKCKL